MNKYSTHFVFVLLVSIPLLFGCTTKEEREAAAYIKDKAVEQALIQKKTDFYKDHQDQLVAKINECRAMTREDYKASKDCTSASRAQTSLGW